MTSDCRRCHYAIEDFLNAEVFDCLEDGARSLRCFDTTRSSYNFEQDFFGISSLAMQLHLISQ